MRRPYYTTKIGKAYLGDALELIKEVPDESVNLLVTSPPFALRRKKEYGNVPPSEYVDWFAKFMNDFWRVLTPDGSLVIDIGGSWNPGEPTRSLYHFELLLRLCTKFRLAQEFYWYNQSRLPSPAEWVTVRRIRAKDAVDPVWWLSRGPFPKADNRRVLQDYSDSMLALLKHGYRPKRRPSGHDISPKFQVDNGGAIPANFLVIANTESNSYYHTKCREAGIKPHPARFPIGLPAFFIKFLTDKGDTVLDPFAGSNVTGEAAEMLGRKWIAFELGEEYLAASRFRFEKPKGVTKRSTGRQPSLFGADA
jgi:site-specific DNA-methyltransferase (cytosine-N4-specific)